MTDAFQLTPEDLESIRALAYEKFVARGCEDGHHEEDWYAAEKELRAAQCSNSEPCSESLALQTSEVKAPKSRSRAVSVSKRTNK